MGVILPLREGCEDGYQVMGLQDIEVIQSRFLKGLEESVVVGVMVEGMEGSDDGGELKHLEMTEPCGD